MTTWKRNRRSNAAACVEAPAVRREPKFAGRAAHKELGLCDHRQTEQWPPGYQRQNGDITVRLPAIPKTPSRVPWLTSLHATNGRGPYGSAMYRGNCSGLFIRDLLTYFQARRVLDPMSGGNTCRDVCAELGIECVSFDIRDGLDAADSANYASLRGFDFVWMHPPYWKLVKYNDDPRCLSQCPTLEDFLHKMRLIFRNCNSTLGRNGKIAVLIGDGREQGCYWGLPFRLLRAAESVGLWLAAPEIIRFGHGATSSHKEYRHAFIPLIHDVCWVLHAKEGEANGHD